MSLAHLGLDPGQTHLDPLANVGMRPPLIGLGLGPRAFSHADLHQMSNAHAELNPYNSQNDLSGLAAQLAGLGGGAMGGQLPLFGGPGARGMMGGAMGGPQGIAMSQALGMLPSGHNLRPNERFASHPDLSMLQHHLQNPQNSRGGGMGILPQGNHLGPGYTGGQPSRQYSPGINYPGTGDTQFSLAGFGAHNGGGPGSLAGFGSTEELLTAYENAGGAGGVPKAISGGGAGHPGLHGYVGRQPTSGHGGHNNSRSSPLGYSPLRSTSASQLQRPQQGQGQGNGPPLGSHHQNPLGYFAGQQQQQQQQQQQGNHSPLRPTDVEPGTGASPVMYGVRSEQSLSTLGGGGHVQGLGGGPGSQEVMLADLHRQQRMQLMQQQQQQAQRDQQELLTAMQSQSGFGLRGGVTSDDGGMADSSRLYNSSQSIGEQQQQQQQQMVNGGGGGVVPDIYCCPLTGNLMTDPVTAADGFTYDREAIRQWLERNDVSPVTQMALSHTGVTPNTGLRNQIIADLSR